MEEETTAHKAKSRPQRSDFLFIVPLYVARVYRGAFKTVDDATTAERFQATRFKDGKRPCFAFD
jgi:hypothetical protein